MSTKNIMFGGKEADIGIALKDTLTVTNYGETRDFKIALNNEPRCNSDMRFKVVIKPKEFTLNKVLLLLIAFFLHISFSLFIERRNNCEHFHQDLLYYNYHRTNRDQG